MKNLRITKKGAFVHNSSKLIDGWEKCNNIDAMLSYADDQKDVETGVRWVGPKLGKAQLEKLAGVIHEFPNKETGYCLCYSARENALAVKCPDQYGTATTIRFDEDSVDVSDGYAVIGTIHTHPEMEAFWSGVDTSDQEKSEGLHIVFGLRKGHIHKMLATITTRYGHYDQKWEDVAEPVDFTADHPADPDWVERIKAQRFKPEPPQFSVYTYSGPPQRPHDWYTCQTKNSWEDNRPWENQWNTGKWADRNPVETDAQLALTLEELDELLTEIGLYIMSQDKDGMQAAMAAVEDILLQHDIQFVEGAEDDYIAEKALDEAEYGNDDVFEVFAEKKEQTHA